MTIVGHPVTQRAKITMGTIFGPFISILSQENILVQNTKNYRILLGHRILKEGLPWKIGISCFQSKCIIHTSCTNYDECIYML